jgi:hypothetical protein
MWPLNLNAAKNIEVEGKRIEIVRLMRKLELRELTTCIRHLYATNQ